MFFPAPLFPKQPIQIPGKKQGLKEFRGMQHMREKKRDFVSKPFFKLMDREEKACRMQFTVHYV